MQVSPEPFVDVRPKCTVCLEQVLLNGYALLNCSHVFHPLCIARCFTGTTAAAACPVCRTPVDSSVLVDLGIDPVTRIFSASSQPSTSIRPAFDVSSRTSNQSVFVFSSRTSNRPVFDVSLRLSNRPGSSSLVPRVECRQNGVSISGSQSLVVSASSSSSSSTPQVWSETLSKLMSSDSENLGSSENPESSCLEKNAFYRHSTLNYLKTFNLTNVQCDQLVSFKRRYGKYALCDAVFRVKVFLALDREFQFTSVDDMLHECKTEHRSAKALEEIYLKYVRDNPQAKTTSTVNSTARGLTVYKFFNLPEPRVRNPSSTLLERSFQTIIKKGFGVTLPVVDRDVCLLKFYKRHPHNLHDVLRYAKLRCKEKFLKKQMLGLKNGIIGCRHDRRRE